MGEIMRQAKIATYGEINKRNFSLLADPALRLSYPKYQVKTTSIMKGGTTLGKDTLGALDKVTVSGYISDFKGNKLSGFQGSIVPVVFDKVIRQKTLGNERPVPYEYNLQENVIYKGLASVKSGEFSFSFVVPRDISYNSGDGKIVYYASSASGTDDANGAYEAFTIGGSSGGQIVDNQGPGINLYIDDTDFKNGDETSRNPLLLAFVTDPNGINTVGSGIGHDIIAVLDNDYANAIVLNGYYKTDIDSYQSGQIRYPMKNLELGEHTLKLKVWDVANNSTEVEIRFVVTGDLTLEKLSNYPNPVNDYTYFSFSHNQPDATFRLILEIFDRQGRRIDMIRQSVSSLDTKIVPLRWDRGNAAAVSGLYVYRVFIQADDGSVASGSGKMLLINH